MDHQTSISRYILVVLAISVVFTTLVLVALNAWVGNNRLSQLSTNVPGLNNLSGKSYDEGYKDGYNDAKEMYKINPLALSDEQYSLNGTIVSVDTEKIVIRKSETMEDVTVNISTTTAIIKRVALTQEQLDEKIKNWEKMDDEGVLNPPPLPIDDTTVTSADLIAGQTVLVSAKDNIYGLDSFEATSVVINSD
ncbi:hypothetical protein KKG46_05135 [Patescibacteria group bacterium]|nr:hypothetical protein [Patescibacteria group bacterium]